MGGVLVARDYEHVQHVLGVQAIRLERIGQGLNVLVPQAALTVPNVDQGAVGHVRLCCETAQGPIQASAQVIEDHAHGVCRGLKGVPPGGSEGSVVCHADSLFGPRPLRQHEHAQKTLQTLSYATLWHAWSRVVTLARMTMGRCNGPEQ